MPQHDTGAASEALVQGALRQKLSTPVACSCDGCNASNARVPVGAYAKNALLATVTTLQSTGKGVDPAVVLIPLFHRHLRDNRSSLGLLSRNHCSVVSRNVFIVVPLQGCKDNYC